MRLSEIKEVLYDVIIAMRAGVTSYNISAHKVAQNLPYDEAKAALDAEVSNYESTMDMPSEWKEDGMGTTIADPKKKITVYLYLRPKRGD